MTYSSLSKRFPNHSYFCGWYFRCQSDKQILAIIPSVHKTKDSAFCTIQVITDTHAFHVQFPYDDFWGVMTKSVSVTTGLESLVSRWISILPNSMLQDLFTSVLLRPKSMTLWTLSICTIHAVPAQRLQYVSPCRWRDPDQRLECLQFFRQSFSDSRNCRHSFVIQLFRSGGICSTPPPPDSESDTRAAGEFCSHCRNLYILQPQP